MIMPSSSSPHLSKSLPLPRPVRGSEKPGIVSILCCDPGTPKASASLRRTLSADMSRKWLEQNGFCPMKNPSSSNNDDEEDTPKKDVEGPPGGCNNTWSSILFQKVEDSKSLPPPYVHPLVKSSKSSLSTQSLKVCTESLGSESGSDGFSSYPASEVRDMDVVEDGHEPQDVAFDVEEFYGVKYEAASGKPRPRSFPPPIQSLSRGNGGCLSINSRRNNGRLVVEAVSIPSEKYLEARREEGRLVLTFATKDQSYLKDEEEIDEEEEDELVMKMDEDNFVDDDEDVIGTTESAPEHIRELSSGRATDVQKLTMMLNKPGVSLNRNPAWQGKHQAFDYEEDEDENLILHEQLLSTPQSAPTTVIASASLNTYEYFWREKSPITISIASNKVIVNNPQPNESWESRFLRRDGCLAASLHSYNSPSRTNLLWKPEFIATS